MRKRFTSPVRIEGKTATSIEVPSSVVEALGPSRRPPVRITVRGYTFRTTVAAYGTQYFVPLSREHRTAAGVEAGEKVTVYLERDAIVFGVRASLQRHRRSNQAVLVSSNGTRSRRAVARGRAPRLSQGLRLGLRHTRQRLGIVAAQRVAVMVA
jgi:Domain of unknown function (DUF1905)